MGIHINVLLLNTNYNKIGLCVLNKVTVNASAFQFVFQVTFLSAIPNVLISIQVC